MNVLNEKVSKKIVILTISIVVVVVLAMSTTYSLIYNSKKLSNNTYTTGILDIQYTEGDAIDLKNNIPMDDESGMLTDPYTITITNTGSLAYKFNLSILSTVEDVDNIIDAEYIRLQIDDNAPVTLSDLTNGVLYSNVILGASESMELNIRMWLSEDTPNTQIGRVYSAKLVANGLAIQNQDDSLHTTSLGYQTLTKLGLDKYASSGDEGIIELSDNNSYLYYFKGNINYNYVLLNGRYYRIILVDSNGNVKLMYAGTLAHDNNYDDSVNKDTIIDEVAFNDKVDSKSYSGYTYLDSNVNEINSNIKNVVEKWYEDNIKDTNIESEIVDTIYCNDRRGLEDEGLVTDAYNRIIDKKIDLSCNPADSYTVSNEIGNGSLSYPVGLISADELYLVSSDYINNNVSFWTMSAVKFEDNMAYNFAYDNKLIINSTDTKMGVRPVMTIKPDKIIGDGSKSSPFEITE